MRFIKLSGLDPKDSVWVNLDAVFTMRRTTITTAGQFATILTDVAGKWVSVAESPEEVLQLHET